MGKPLQPLDFPTFSRVGTLKMVFPHAAGGLVIWWGWWGMLFSCPRPSVYRLELRFENGPKSYLGVSGT